MLRRPHSTCVAAAAVVVVVVVVVATLSTTAHALRVRAVDHDYGMLLLSSSSSSSSLASLSSPPGASSSSSSFCANDFSSHPPNVEPPTVANGGLRCTPVWPSTQRRGWLASVVAVVELAAGAVPPVPADAATRAELRRVSTGVAAVWTRVVQWQALVAALTNLTLNDASEIAAGVAGVASSVWPALDAPIVGVHLPSEMAARAVNVSIPPLVAALDYADERMQVLATGWHGAANAALDAATSLRSIAIAQRDAERRLASARASVAAIEAELADFARNGLACAPTPSSSSDPACTAMLAAYAAANSSVVGTVAAVAYLGAAAALPIADALEQRVGSRDLLPLFTPITTAMSEASAQLTRARIDFAVNFAGDQTQTAMLAARAALESAARAFDTLQLELCSAAFT